MNRPDHAVTRLWAWPALAMALLGVPLYLYVPKFYAGAGADVGVLGLCILGARILDGLLDPAIGLVSDGLRSRWGRRRPFLFLASPLAAGCFLGLYLPPFSPPGVGGGAGLERWFGLWLAACTVSFSSVLVPWEALGPELTGDGPARTRLYGWKDGATLAGTLLAAALPAAMQRGLGWDMARVLPAMGLLGGGLLWWSCWRLVLRTRESGTREAASPATHGPRTPPWTGFRQAWDNRPFRILLGAALVAGIGANLPATLIVFYVEHVLGSDDAPLFLLLYFVTGMASLPLWTRLADRVGRARAWLWAMGGNAGAFLFVFFLGPGDAAWYGLLAALSGVGFGATLFLPSALVADCVDADATRHGRRREGLYLGVWSVLRTLVSALGMGVALPLLEAAGYVAGQREQPAAVIWTLRLLYALVPACCALAAILVARGYPSAMLQEKRGMP